LRYERGDRSDRFAAAFVLPEHAGGAIRGGDGTCRKGRLEPKRDQRLEQELKKPDRFDVLILDDIG
jgi:hypothetical protein